MLKKNVSKKSLFREGMLKQNASKRSRATECKSEASYV